MKLEMESNEALLLSIDATGCFDESGTLTDEGREKIQRELRDKLSRRWPLLSPQTVELMAKELLAKADLSRSTTPLRDCAVAAKTGVQILERMDRELDDLDLPDLLVNLAQQFAAKGRGSAPHVYGLGVVAAQLGTAHSLITEARKFLAQELTCECLREESRAHREPDPDAN